MIRVGLVIASLVMLPSLSMAQGRGHATVRLSGGGTVGAPVNSAVAAGAFGWNLSEDMELFGEVGRVGDTRSRQQDDIIKFFPAYVGAPVEVNARFPAMDVLGGVRVTFARSHRVSPIAEAGFGWARVRPEIAATITGLDVSDVTRDFIPDGHEAANHTASKIGAGVAVRVSRKFTIDATYRLLHLAGAQPSDTSALVTAVGVRF